MNETKLMSGQGQTETSAFCTIIMEAQPLAEGTVHRKRKKELKQ